MGGAVQSVRHEPDPAHVGWLAAADGDLEHVGRKSGKPYRTPLNVFATDDGLAIVLTYGPDRDWLKNITATGHGRMRHRGRKIELTNHRVMPKAEAARAVKGLWKPIFARMPFEQAVMLSRAD